MNTKNLIISALAVLLGAGLVNCNRPMAKKNDPPPATIGKCTPAIESARTAAMSSIKGNSPEAIDRCKAFESSAGRMAACTSSDGKLVSLKDDLKACHDYQLTAAAKPSNKPGQTPMRADTQGSLTKAVPEKLEVSRWAWVNSLKKAGEIESISGDRAAIRFFDPKTATESVESVAVSDLVPEVQGTSISVCGEERTLSDKTLLSSNDHSIYRVVKAFANGKIEVEPQVVSQKWFVLFADGYDLVAGSRKAIDASEITGVEVKCQDEICQDAQLSSPTKLPKSEVWGAGGYVASKVFCDGTLGVKAYTKSKDGYTEMIYPASNFKK